MYTHCSNCQTYFTVQQEDLKIASGKVRCGHCGYIFNALEHLYDELPKTKNTPTHPAISPPSKPEPTSFADLQAQFLENFDNNDFNDNEPSDISRIYADLNHDDVASKKDDLQSLREEFNNLKKDPIDTDISQEIQKSKVIQNKTPPLATTSTTDTSTTEKTTPLIATQQGEKKNTSSSQSNLSPSKTTTPAFGKSEQDLINNYLDNEAPTHNRSAMIVIIWVFVFLGMTAVFTLQYAYFNSEKLAKGSFRPYILKFCDITHCSVPLEKIPETLLTLESNIQEHPKDKTALWIHISFVNQARTAQAYPDLLITFSNLVDEVIAKRQFSPAEYLDATVDIKAGMQPDVPVNVDLKIDDIGGGNPLSYQVDYL